MINVCLLVNPRENGYSCNAKPTRGEKTGDEQCNGDESRDKDWAENNEQRCCNSQSYDSSNKGKAGEDKERTTSCDSSSSFSNLPRLGVVGPSSGHLVLVSVSANHRVLVSAYDIVMGCSTCIRHFLFLLNRENERS